MKTIHCLDSVLPQFKKLALWLVFITITPVLFAQQEAALISGITVAEAEGKVMISWQYPKTAEKKTFNILLYRSVSPIASTKDLFDAIIIQSFTNSANSTADYPLPGTLYYYALINEAEIKAGSITIIPGENATKKAIALAGGANRAVKNQARPLPLPLMSPGALIPAVAGPQNMGEPIPLSKGASGCITALLATSNESRPAHRRPRAFPQDLEIPAGGDDYALRSIVQGVFAKKNWIEAAKQIDQYLALSRNPASEARAHYYLGQAQYFRGNYREALFEFLLSQSSYQTESQDWIEAVMVQMIYDARHDK